MEPAHVLVTRSISQSAAAKVGSFVVGEWEGPVRARTEEVAAIFRHVGEAQVTENLIGERWSKLIINCVANPVAGATGMRSAQLWRNAAAREVSTHIAAEAVRVAQSHEVSVPSVMGDLTVEEALASAEGRSTRMQDVLLARSMRVHPKGMPSLLQDVLKGRPTEVDYLNGLVVRKGREAGVATPANRAIVELVHGPAPRRWPR